MSNEVNIDNSTEVSNEQQGTNNKAGIDNSKNIKNKQISSSSNNSIILIIAIAIIGGSFFFLSEGKDISKELLGILYALVSLSVAIIGNFLIGTINISYKNDEGIIKASGSIALFIFTLLTLIYGVN